MNFTRARGIYFISKTYTPSPILPAVWNFIRLIMRMPPKNVYRTTMTESDRRMEIAAGDDDGRIARAVERRVWRAYYKRASFVCRPVDFHRFAARGLPGWLKTNSPVPTMTAAADLPPSLHVQTRTHVALSCTRASVRGARRSRVL